MSISTFSRAAARHLLLIGAVVATPAWATKADYQCEDGTTLNGDFSPRTAQVRYEGQAWALQRARDSHEARYVSPKDGVTVTMVHRDAVLERKGQPKLACKLVVQALRPEALGLAPPPATASAPSR